MKRTKRPVSKGARNIDYQNVQQTIQAPKQAVVIETEEPLYDDSIISKSRKAAMPKIMGKKGFDYIDEVVRPIAFEVPTPKPPAKIIDVKKLESIVQNNELDFSKLDELVDMLESAERIDFSGLESATDFLFYKLSKKIRTHANKHLINLQNIYLNGCKNISISSLAYLYEAFQKNIFDIADDKKVRIDLMYIFQKDFLPEQARLLSLIFNKPVKYSQRHFNLKFRYKICACNKITDSLIASLMHKDAKIPRDDKFCISGKIVIIHEDSNQFNLCSILSKDSLPQQKNGFNYVVIKNKGKNLNVYECSESSANIFLSERNLVILTFDTKNPDESVVNSIIKRLLDVITKSVLPNNIMVLGICDANSISVDVVKAAVLDQINHLIQVIEANVEKVSSNNKALPFQVQQALSQQINLCEELKAIERNLYFSSIDINDRTVSLKTSQTASEANETANYKKELEEIETILSEALRLLDGINKSDIVELKAIKYPPTPVNMVAECVCLLFNTKPSFDNFKKLANKTDFIQLVKQYNKDNISDYTLDQLSKYINNQDFTYEYVKKFSNASGVLCAWSKAMYTYAKAIGPLMEKMKAVQHTMSETGSFDTLIDYITEKTCYLFAWPSFYNEMSIEDINYDTSLKNIHASIQKINFQRQPFYEIQDYIKLFDDDRVLIDAMQNKYSSLPEKYAKCQTAKGTQYYNENLKMKYVITDIAWFSKTINMLFKEPSHTICFKDTIGESVPIWEFNRFKENVGNFLQKDKVDQFIKYLIEINLITKITDKSSDTSYIIPTTSLTDTPATQLEDFWLDEWKGYEIDFTYQTYCTIPIQAVFTVLQNFQHKNILLLWKNGFLVRDNVCDVLFRFSNKKAKLEVRMINAIDQLKLEGESAEHYMHNTFMEYLLLLEYVVLLYNIPFQNFDSVYATCQKLKLIPFAEETTKGLYETKPYSYYEHLKNYYLQNIANEHNLKPISSTDVESELGCTDCGVSFNIAKHQIKCCSFIYPNFVHFPFQYKIYETKADKSPNDSVLDVLASSVLNIMIKPKTTNLIECTVSLSPTEFSTLDIGFIEPAFENCVVEYLIHFQDGKSTGSNYVSIDILRRTFTEKFDSIKDVTKSKSLKLAERNASTSQNAYPIKSNIRNSDSLKLNMEKLTENSCYLTLYHNADKLISYKLNNWRILRIIPTLKCEFNEKFVTQAQRTQDSYIIVSNTDIAYLSNSAHSTQSNMRRLIGMKCEARDRKNPSICAPATITNVDQQGMVKIHFDGWGETYDYWAHLSDQDIMPCGHWDYYTIKFNRSGFNGMNRFDPPKSYSKKLVWSEYLADLGTTAVPFHLFTRKQKNGMQYADFQDNKSKHASVYCGFLFNPRVKQTLIENELRKNYAKTIRMLNIKNGNLQEGVRGLVLLPDGLTSAFYNRPSATFLNDVSKYDHLQMHMTCISFKDEDNDSTVYSHMLDINGISFERKLLNDSLAFYILISSYALYNADNPTIIPCWSELFPDIYSLLNEDSRSEAIINKKFRQYFYDIFKLMSLFLSEDVFNTTIIEADISQFLKLLSIDDLKQNEYFFTRKMCYYCHLCDFNPVEVITDRIVQTREYGKCLLQFNMYQPTNDNIDKEKISMNEKFFQHFCNIKTLYIENCRITNLDTTLPNFDNLKRLEDITLINTGLTELPHIIWDIKNLKTMCIANNRIKTFNTDNQSADQLPENMFTDLTNLTTLSLKSLPIYAKDLFKNKEQGLFKLPTNLKVLEIDNLPLNVMPFSFENCIDSLTHLNFSGLRWITLEEIGGINSILALPNFMNKYRFLMAKKEIEDLFYKFDSDKSDALSANEIYKFNAYIYKKYPRLGDTIMKLLDLKGGIPLSIFSLRNLVSLNLSFHAITRLPDEIEQLKNLQELILDNCIRLEILSGKIADLPLKKISLSNCLSLKTPPIEISRRGTQSILSYMKRLSSGSVQCKRTKLMLVGLGEAGKTSLLRALSQSNLGAYGSMPAPKVTDGIEIEDWDIDLNDNTKLTFSMWDFAGQSVYYNTHQFFLSTRGVYLLVWNVRLGAEYAGLDFWLNSISCHAPGAPIFIVGTHIDQVAKYELNREELQSRYKHIVGFHFVSSHNGDGINELSKRLVDVTLQEKYIGELIPEVWLNFEKAVKAVNEKQIISYQEIANIAEKAGIYDSKELLQAIRFLHDLGSLQYFENSLLKDKVVINPQWIVDMMACVVSVRENGIQEGKLYHDKIDKIWSKYDPLMHNWMLKLTEEFDLTFPVNEQKFNLVPCLLADKEPEYEWPAIDEDNISKIKEFKVIYNFVYLPAGLFNRLQVRLYQYADSTIIWKSGSLLKKNKHLALITQTKKQSVHIKVQGVKPENIIYVIHEVIEVLINESFHGIEFDYSFPCPDCTNAGAVDTFMFSASLLRRATELHAPFVQCHKFFHAISIQEMLAVMPLDNASNLDLHLEYSIRDLKQLKNNFKYDITAWYCEGDIPISEEDEATCISPLLIINELKKYKYKIWYSDNPKLEKFEKITSAIKDSKIVLLFISDEFSKDEKCTQIFDLTKTIIRKNYFLVELGKINSHKWMENPKYASICSDYRCIMQDPKRLTFKLAELFEKLDTYIGERFKDKDDSNDGEKKPHDVFISYCWANSQDAVTKGTKTTHTGLGWVDPRAIYHYLKSNGIDAWIDFQQMGSSALFDDITKGMNEAAVIISCISDEYVKSRSCVLEFRFAHCSLKIPIVKAIVGTGNEWKKHEISFLSGSYPEINFQFENPDAHSQLLHYVREEIEKVKSKVAKVDETLEEEKVDKNASAFQELYELTQRKFLRQLAQFSDKMNIGRLFPRLIFIDLIEREKIQSLIKDFGLEETIRPSNSRKQNVPVLNTTDTERNTDDESQPSARRLSVVSSIPENEETSASLNHSIKREDEPHGGTRRLSIASNIPEDEEAVLSESFKKEDAHPLNATIRPSENEPTIKLNTKGRNKAFLPCLRIMCEYEEGWHRVETYTALSEMKNSFCPYLSRMMNLLKNGPLSTELNLFLSDDGKKIFNQIEALSETDDNDINASYTAVRTFFAENQIICLEKNDTNVQNFTGLYRCELQSGKIIWMCSKHIELTGAQILDDHDSQVIVNTFEEKNAMLENVLKIEDIELSTTL